MTEEPRDKAELLDRVEARWNVLQALLARLSASQQEQPLGDGWSPKVHVAHLTLWERSLMGLLRKQDRAAAMGIPTETWASHDTDAINAIAAERAMPRPYAEVAAESRAVHAELLTLLGSLSPSDLELPYSHYQPADPEPNPAPVAGWVHGNTWDHYNEHISWLEAGLA